MFGGAPRDPVWLGRAIAAAGTGDPGALSYLYVRFAEPVHRSFSAAGVADDAALELTTEALSADRIRRYDAERDGPFEAWLSESLALVA